MMATTLLLDMNADCWMKNSATPVSRRAVWGANVRKRARLIYATKRPRRPLTVRYHVGEPACTGTVHSGVSVFPYD